MPLDSRNLSDVDRDELFGLLGQFDVDPKDVRPEVALVRGESGWELHLSRFVRRYDGRLLLDHAREEAVTQPFVLHLGVERPPHFLLKTANISWYRPDLDGISVIETDGDDAFRRAARKIADIL